MRTYGRITAPAASINVLGSCVVSGNTVSKSLNAITDWNSGVVTATPYTSVQITAAYNAGVHLAIGLVANPASAIDVTLMNYALYVDTQFTEYVIFESGVQVLNIAQAPVVGDALKVSYAGGVVNYYINNSVVRTTTATGAYYAAIAMYDPGDVFTNVAIGPVGMPVPLTGAPFWVEVDTDANGYNDEVYLTTLCQVLALNLNESPFYANLGIPAQQSVLQQVYPDFYVKQTQQYFAQYFASLTVNRVSDNPPTYNVVAVTHQGAILAAQVAT